MADHTPNTQGASWEEEFIKLKPHKKNCHIWDFLDHPKKGECTCGTFKMLFFIRTLLSKERAEGERRGAERVVEYVESQIPEVHGEAVHKQELAEILKEARTLPADSTESV